MSLLKSYLFCVLSTTVLGQLTIDGNCPEMCTPSGLNVTADQLTGIWFLQLSIPYFYEDTATCSYSYTYTVDDGKYLHFQKFMQFPGVSGLKIINGTTELQSDGRSLSRYTEIGLPLHTQIVAVTPDYRIKIGCFECGYFQKEGAGIYAKVYTRMQYPSCELMQEATQIVEGCGIPRNYLTTQDQNNCNQC